MSTKKIKAKRMWADHPNAAMFKVIKIRCYGCDHRILILPDTPEAYYQMVEQVANKKTPGRYPVPIGVINARAALASIGVTRPKEGKK